MACSIQLIHVNLINCLSGQQLRVMGRASGCPGSLVTVSSSITGSQTVSVDPYVERFVATLPVISPAQCGQSITVDVACDQDPNCKLPATERVVTIDCCSIDALYFNATVGGLNPTAIVVHGVLLGCCDDKVVVRVISPVAIGPSQATQITNQLTGEFHVTLPIPQAVTLNCGDRIVVRAECAQDPTNCYREFEEKLDCGPCPRAQVSYTNLPCTGLPLVQPTTFQQTIQIPANQVYTFMWDYGDGSSGPPFTVNNTGGTANTTYNPADPGSPHDYLPGSYTAKLMLISPGVENCPEITLPVVVSCNNCPTIFIRPPSYSSSCIGGGRPVTLAADVTTQAGVPVVLEWDFGDPNNPFAKQTCTIQAGLTQICQTNPYPYPAPGSTPTTYTAILRTLSPSGCPNVPVQVTVQPCGVTCPPNSNATILAEIESPPGVWKPITQTQCVGQNTPVRFTATVNPSGATIRKYKWDFKDPSAPTSPTASNSNNPERITSSTTDIQTHIYSQAAPNQQAYAPTVQVFFNETDCDPIVSSTSVLICPPCSSVVAGSLRASFSSPLQPPQQLNPNDANSCVPAGTPVDFEVSVNNPGNLSLTLDWDFGDGSPLVTTPGPNDPPITGNPAIVRVQHTYSQWRAQPYTARVTLRVPQNCPSSYTHIDIRVCSGDTVPPTVNNCNVVAGNPGTISVTFSEDVDQNAATNPANFSIRVNNSPRTPTSLSYTPNTTTINGININPGDTVQITVVNVADKAGNVIVSNNSASCSAPRNGNGSGKGSMSAGCWILLVLALFSIITGAIAFWIGLCLQGAGVVYAFWIWGAGIAAMVVGLALLALWLWLCVTTSTDGCKILNWITALFRWILYIFPIIAAIILLLTGSYSNIPCLIGALVAWGYYGTVYAILTDPNLRRWVQCPLEQPF